MNNLGLVEVGAVSRSRDAADKKADISFDPSLAFNPMSSLINYTRKGGITSDVVMPNGGESIFKGQTFVADLSGAFDSVLKPNNAVFVSIGAKSKGSRAYDLQQLINKLTDRQSANKTAAQTKKKSAKAAKAKEPSRQERILDKLLAGKKPLIVDADRATDLLAMIKLKKQFNLQLVISGAADAVVVAEQLAKANIPVIVSAMRDLPNSFDSMHNSLDNAAKLAKAGVKIILAVNDAHNLYQLRFDAGNAVSYGLTPEQALASVTSNVADVFNLESGKIAEGKTADLVMWNADPFELSSHVEKMWIGGQEVSTESRQDALLKRYTTASKMPKAYIK